MARYAVVDYALQRRALLTGVRSGRIGVAEVCDAHPYLLRAAQYHGEPSGQDCPICRADRLTHVRYVYGEDLRHVSGQAKTAAELDRLEGTGRGFSVYTVEVCRTCTWNHLVTSYQVGAKPELARAAPRHSRQAARE